MSHLRISRAIAALVVVSAIVVPAASARPIDAPGVVPEIATDMHSAIPRVEPTPEGAGAPTGGFDWDDAALGGAATLVVLSLGVASAVTVRRGRARRHPLVGG
jgi:hypothetical protein